MALVICVIFKSNEVYAEADEIKCGGKHRLDLADPSNREKRPDKIRCISNATALLISSPIEVSSYSSSIWVVVDNDLNPYWRKGGVSTPICSMRDKKVAAQDDQEIAICVNC